MHTIAREFFQETSVHTFTAEIAELAHSKQLEGRRGLPTKFTIPGVGNGNPFTATKIDRREGDLMYVEYMQLFGCVKVIIFND